MTSKSRTPAMLLPAAALAVGTALATWRVLHRPTEEVLAELADRERASGDGRYDPTYLIGPLPLSDGAVTVIGVGGAVLAAAALTVLAVLAATRRIGPLHLVTALLLVPLGAVVGGWWMMATAVYPDLGLDPGRRLIFNSIPWAVAGLVLLPAPVVTLVIAGVMERKRMRGQAQAHAHWQS
ncbi:hypothetical protein O4J56_03165 [Nocardiopsis sp. RSe5-2]|uniref:Uncharacterized protein n=1 Tax=Nocardiopsis endophytica TaxID=3018445 RepID=A0ABT4TYZ9_9ACTN|nr:hypothetical protein [Nocardiopsis endophytica]MDA2809631.1 hypothetical protein [Nocardiopsis endophytica]